MHGDVVAGPSNGAGARACFLINGLAKPVEVGVVCLSTTSAANCVASLENGSEAVEVLSTDLLSTVLHRQFTTVTCIPHQCRLALSRALKTFLDRVIVIPDNLSAWLRLILLPICTLSLFKPRSAAEEKSGNRKCIQVAEINQALSVWKEPNGCYVLVNNLLHQPVHMRSMKADLKKQGASNLTSSEA